MSMSLLLAFVSLPVLAWIGRREHRALQAARRCLLDDCVASLEQAELTLPPDNFPKLAGLSHGRSVRAELIPDTMTIRRLPQLWLSATLLAGNDGVPGLDILVRPTGSEFYALSDRFACRFEAPADFPTEALVRGEPGADKLLADISPVLAAILADPRVKEIAITRRGVRIVRQVGEGKRGEHLLLRQAQFQDARVSRATFDGILRQLDLLRAAVAAHGQARAA